jgi:abortive infection bacteriophage resistance protein
MQYNKPPLTYEQQADLLISRGLIADKFDLISKLKEVNYSRLKFLNTTKTGLPPSK